MTVAEIVTALGRFNNTERLTIIEVATRLIREELATRPSGDKADQDRRLADSARELVDLYQPGGELAEWTALDGEEVLDDYLPR